MGFSSTFQLDHHDSCTVEDLCCNLRDGYMFMMSHSGKTDPNRPTYSSNGDISRQFRSIDNINGQQRTKRRKTDK